MREACLKPQVVAAILLGEVVVYMVTKDCVVGGRKTNDDTAQILNKAIKIYQLYVVCDFKTVIQTQIFPLQGLQC